MNLGWLHEVCPPREISPRKKSWERVFPTKKMDVWSRNLCKAISPWYPKQPFFHRMIGEKNMFHVHNFGVTQLEFQSSWTFLKKKILTCEATVGVVLFGGGSQR